MVGQIAVFLPTLHTIPSTSNAAWPVAWSHDDLTDWAWIGRANKNYSKTNHARICFSWILCRLALTERTEHCSNVEQAFCDLQSNPGSYRRSTDPPTPRQGLAAALRYETQARSNLVRLSSEWTSFRRIGM